MKILFQLSHGTDKWVTEFANKTQHVGADDQWVNEFSKLNLHNDWAEEFGQQVSQGVLGESSDDKWIDAYDR